MLKRKYRLSVSKKIPFKSIFNTPFFTLKVAPSTLPYNRYGFIVSKQIDKRAVARNRVKRVLRSCVEEIFGQIRPGFDMILIVRKGAVESPRENLMRVFREQLEKASLL